jgi:leucyl-tRNA synthetase
MKKDAAYNHLTIEKKWQKEWEKKKVYKTENSGKKKKHYVLDMFPYPSGAGLHVGHPRGYIGSDVYARFKRMQGFNVLHPMGYDAFGLPAEQFAIANKIHPRKAVEVNVATFERQLGIIGLSYDWSRKVNTTDPGYYKWTQWIFLQLYNSYYDQEKNKARPISELIKKFEKKNKEWKQLSKIEQEKILMQHRLAYEGYSDVNWSPSMGTVLANDEVLDTPNGPVAERDGKPVEKKRMRQWFMRITSFAERLLTGLDGLDWSEHIKEIQKNWIGKSEGSLIRFPLQVENKKTVSKILVGTRNEAKFKMVKACFPKMEGVELVSLNDIPAVDDSALVEGADYEENARMKAEFYFKKTGIPTISTDNIFWLEKWPKNNGVLVHMRKEANPKSERATDEEVLAWLKKWVKSVGGKSSAHFKYAVSFANEQGTVSFTSTQREYILQGKQSKKFWPGYPTESLLIDQETGEYKGSQKDIVRYKNLITDFNREAPLWLGKLPEVEIFTTRADTLASAFAVILSPEHELVSKLKNQIENFKEVEAYIKEAGKKTEEDRTNAEKEKNGVALKGIFATNPLTKEKIPVWIADFVLAHYGTGAIFADMHDERDFMFAKKYNLPLRQSVMPILSDGINPPRALKENTKRDVVHVILRNQKEKTVLVGFLKDASWGDRKPVNFIIGGIENGESLEETARREIEEETGYTDVRFIERIPLDIQAEFFQAQKNVNRQAHVRTLIFDLVSEAKKPVAEEEMAKHEFRFIKESEVASLLNVEDDKTTWRYYQTGGFAYTGEGVLVNSGEFDGLTTEEARKQITKAVGGEWVTKYKMRDAVFARQRYWGEPIPLKHTKEGMIMPLKEKELPLKLPNVTSYEPTGTGESPLSAVKSWMKEGYETNTMPGWAGSSWYFLRYMDPKNKKEFASKKNLAYWREVDMYVGGQEHATGHLLYARFWHKALYDLGYVPTEEPFKALRNQGMIGGADGRKMSKRWGNVVNPDDVVATYGADSLRVFEMFLGPFDSHLPWSTEGIIGSRRFIEKTWRLAQKVFEADKTKSTPEAEKAIHRAIKKVTEDITTFSFNTAVSAMMIAVNELEKSEAVSRADFMQFITILAPFAPHVADELWAQGKGKGSIQHAAWPTYNPAKLVESTARVVVSINGKPRAEIIVSRDAPQAEVEGAALQDEKIKTHLMDKKIVRVIYIPNKLINLVIA